MNQNCKWLLKKVEIQEIVENLIIMFYPPVLVDIVDDRVFWGNSGLDVIPDPWLLRISLWGVLNTMCQYILWKGTRNCN